MSVLIGVLSTKTQRKRTKNTIILVFIVVAIVIVTVVIKVVELVVEIVVVVVVVVVIVVVNVVVLVIVIVVQYDDQIKKFHLCIQVFHKISGMIYCL